MTYKLYLDDLRYPPDINWVIARNYHDAVWYVKNMGVPYHISFDHDLAYEHYHTDQFAEDYMDKKASDAPREFTGYDFAKWFCYYCQDNNVDLSNFTYHVHSANPVGAQNIRMFMKSFMENKYV